MRYILSFAFFGVILIVCMVIKATPNNEYTNNSIEGEARMLNDPAYRKSLSGLMKICINNYYEDKNELGASKEVAMYRYDGCKSQARELAHTTMGPK